MPMNTANNQESEGIWNSELRTAFNDFKKRRRSLPTPPEVEIAVNTPKKQKHYARRNVNGNKFIRNKINPVDINHTVMHEKNDFLPDTNMRNSTMSERFVSMDTSESGLDLTEVQCDEFDRNLASTLEMIKKKEDPHLILEKLVSQLSDNNKKTQESIHKMSNDYVSRCNYLNDQLVKLENSVIKKINYVIEKNDERVKALEITQKCSNENNIIWLSFTDPKEIDDLRVKTKSELIRDTKKIFSRMDIQLNSVNRVIIDVFINKVSIKTSNGYDNELIMGVKFISSGVVRDLKRLAFSYAREQFISKHYDAIRYIIRDNWSVDIWKLLRVCYDLTNFKLIQKAHVSDAGIMVYYNNSENPPDSNTTIKESHKTLIRTESDLDELRSSIKDVGLEMSAFQFYNSEYFKLNAMERNNYKQGFIKESSVLNNINSDTTATNSNNCGINVQAN
ncbi:unnamed protein product [Chironomus riparius]|uniref:Uncharacterized protein n=1 Tax=Chironomus riparius TaxID=315576 RepID=A0A9N9WT16_9DIPT|nr:unnamed protein product [Chironomus riparius]